MYLSTMHLLQGKYYWKKKGHFLRFFLEFGGEGFEKKKGASGSNRRH